MSSTLHDAKNCLCLIRIDILSMGFERSRCPLMRPLHRFLLIFVRLGRRGALIKCEEDVGTERGLYLHGPCRGEAMKRTVKMRRERDTFIIDDSELPVLARNVLIIDRNTFFEWCFLFCKFRNSLAKRRAERENLEAARVSD